MSQIKLNNDQATGFRFAVDLANTWDIWFDEPEKLKTKADLDLFLALHGWERLTQTDDDVLDAVKRLRAELRSIFASQTAQEAVDMLTALLAKHLVEPRLMVDAPEVGEVAMTYGPRPGAGVAEQIRVITGLGVATALERWGVERLRVCEADRCEDVFVDTSKNGRRRYCGVRCQNRINVAAMRQRSAQARIEQH